MILAILSSVILGLQFVYLICYLINQCSVYVNTIEYLDYIVGVIIIACICIRSIYTYCKYTHMNNKYGYESINENEEII